MMLGFPVPATDVGHAASYASAPPPGEAVWRAAKLRYTSMAKRRLLISTLGSRGTVNACRQRLQCMCRTHSAVRPLEAAQGKSGSCETPISVVIACKPHAAE